MLTQCASATWVLALKKSAVGIYEGNAVTGLRVGGGSSEVFAADPVAVVFLRIPFASCKIW